jgi:arabinogalactan endo-1,4-beta-galactosidase
MVLLALTSLTSVHAQSPNSGEIYRLVNQKSGLVADPSGSSSKSGASIVQAKTDYTSLSQRWAFNELPSGIWEITNVADGLCLAASGTNLVQEPYTGASDQEWRLSPSGNGYYTIVNAVSGAAIDVQNSSKLNDARLAVTTLTGAPTQSQRWLTRPAFYRGGDLTFVETEEADRLAAGLGGWKDNYVEDDPFRTFKNHGINLIRVDWFVVPVQGSMPIANAMSLDIAKRAMNLGMSIELTIEVTDTWATQTPIPQAWQNLTYAQLKKTVRDYCAQTIETFRQNGVMPDIVTIGNEVNLGWLGAAGTWWNNTPYRGGPASGITRFEQLQTAGMAGVRDGAASTSVGPAIPPPLCGIHYAGPSGLESFFSQFSGGAIPYDVICESYYPFYHGPLYTWQANPYSEDFDQPDVIHAAEDLGKPIFNLECGEHNGADNLVASDPWFDASPASQRQFLLDLTSVQETIPNNLGLGACYWEPEGVEIPGWGNVNYWEWHENALYAQGASTSDPNWSNLLPGIDGLGGKLDANLRYELVNAKTGRIAATSGAKAVAGSKVGFASNNGHPETYAQWLIASNGDGYFEIKCAADGEALDDNGAATAGAKIVQEPVSGNSSQEWDVVSAGGGLFNIVNRGSGDVLDVNGAYLVQKPASAGIPSQDWQIVAVYSGVNPGNLVSNGTYVITGVGSGLPLDDPGGSTAAGTRIDIATASGSSNQSWTLVNLGYNLVALVNGASDMALEDPSGSASEGNVIDQAPYTGAPYQKWLVVPVSPGIFSLENAATGMFLDVWGAGTSSGTATDQWPSNGQTNQQWRF